MTTTILQLALRIHTLLHTPHVATEQKPSIYAVCETAKGDSVAMCDDYQHEGE